MKQINFLSVRHQLARPRRKRFLFKQRFSFILAAIYSLLFLLNFGVYFFLVQQGKKLDEEIASQKQKLETVTATETKIFYLKNKTRNLKQIFLTTQNHKSLIEGFFNILPAGIEVNNFTVADPGEVSFQGTAIDFNSLNQLLLNLKKGQFGGNPIYAVEIGRVFWNQEKNYSFEVKIFLYPLSKSVETDKGVVESEY